MVILGNFKDNYGTVTTTANVSVTQSCSWLFCKVGLLVCLQKKQDTGPNCSGWESFGFTVDENLKAFVP